MKKTHILFGLVLPISLSLASVGFLSSTFAQQHSSIKVRLSEGAYISTPATKSVDYTVDFNSEDNNLDLKKVLSEEFKKSGTIFKLLEEGNLPVGFVFDTLEKILSISKEEVKEGEYVLPYEMCIEKKSRLNDLEFGVSSSEGDRYRPTQRVD